ncbi:hypothetical protein ACFZC6_11825 [Streptomyces ossamyceticus]|uniref:hypothetical protein n=1 Tax=Streptomyces ossamyceticus TaxID=249581 RepID=UPI0036ECD4BA
MTIYSAAVWYIADEFIITEKGPLINEEELPDPLYPQKESVTIYSEQGNEVLGSIQRTVVYPKSKEKQWIIGYIYFWAWNDAYAQTRTGKMTVRTRETGLYATADGIRTGTLLKGTQAKKLYLNQRNSWSLCIIRVRVHADEVGANERSLGTWDDLLGSSYPVITVTTRQSGDAEGRRTTQTLHDYGWVIVLIIAMPLLSLVAWAKKGRRIVTTNKFTIAGVTSSAINIQSPLATAIVELDKKGDSDSARALTKLTDLIASSRLPEAQKEELTGLIQALAEEAKRPEPRKVNMKALGTQLALGIAGSIIATEAEPLIEVIKHLWN